MRVAVGSGSWRRVMMHFHADHALFFGRRTDLRRSLVRLVLTLGVLLVNVGAQNLGVSLSLAVVGAILLMKAGYQGNHRLQPAIAWILVLVTCAVLGGAWIGDYSGAFAEIAARVGCGVLWVLWLGTQLDWATLRHMLFLVKVPRPVLQSLDYAVMSGVLTQSEWIRRRDAARMRLGTPRLPLQTWGKVLGEGALGSFIRLQHVEENSLLRSGALAGETSERTIRLQEVSVDRGEQRILERLDLEIGAGEWVLLCGASGAGKSSLLRLIAGLDKPAEGTFTRLGMTVGKRADLAARLDGRVALLTQNPEHHFIASTVLEDIAWGLVQRGVDTDQAKIVAEEMAASLGVDHLLERPCHTLSFGEQRRVALAGLLVSNPDVLLVDEPTAGLDPVAAHSLRSLVSDWADKTGATCIWATHDLHLIPSHAKRVVLLREGHVIFDGDVNEGLSKTWLAQAGLLADASEESPC